MVLEQIERRGVVDPRVLRAMESVPRHLFVPESFQTSAYEDAPLPIGEGQTISQPYIVAFMSEAIRPRPTDRVLEIGTGSGYQTAVLSRLVRHVFTIEMRPQLVEAAGARRWWLRRRGRSGRMDRLVCRTWNRTCGSPKILFCHSDGGM